MPRSMQLRRIAEHILRQVLARPLGPETEGALATSLVRQWLTYDGHAGLFFPGGQVWLRIRAVAGDRQEVEVGKIPRSSVRSFMHHWHFGEEILPEILENLNVAQSAAFVNRRGMRLRLWVNPKERSIHMEEIRDEG